MASKIRLLGPVKKCDCECPPKPIVGEFSYDPCNCSSETACSNNCVLTGSEPFDALVHALGNNAGFSASASKGTNTLSVSGSDGGGSGGAGIQVQPKIKTLEANTSLSIAGSFTGSPPISLAMSFQVIGVGSLNFSASPAYGTILIPSAGEYCIRVVAAGGGDAGDSVSFSATLAADKDVEFCEVATGGGGGPPGGP